MGNPARIAGQLRRQTAAELEALACDVESRYLNREYQCTTLPMHKRGPNAHRTPKTALIALAAQRKALKRQVADMIEMAFCFTETLEDDVHDLVSIRDILARVQSRDFPAITKESA